VSEILALVTDAYGGTGGIALYNRDVLQAMSDDPAIHKVHCLPRVISAPLEPVPAKVAFQGEAANGNRAYLMALFKVWRKRRGISLVYCAHINLVPVAWIMAKLFRIPWVLCLYGIEAWSPPNRRLTAGLSKTASRILSISQITLDRFRVWQPVPVDRCAITPNAIHRNLYSVLPRDESLATRLGLAGRTVIMTLGRLDPLEQAKGFDRVIAAMPALLKARPDLAYLIAGTGADKARLEALADEAGVRDAVIFCGFVPEAEKARYYALADAYVMPSNLEGFGFVFLEAMACGLPVVASATDGGREAVLDGRLGAIVDPDDPEALVNAILSAIDKPKAVPPELDQFSFERFSGRMRDALAPYLRSG
jgi:phosphatidyl-myo-inositol dimannoside synthase